MRSKDPRVLKRALSEAHNEKFNSGAKKRSRKHKRRDARRARVERRELAWLAASGIERDERWPLS